MASRIAEHETVGCIRLMIEALSSGAFDAGRGFLQIIDEEIDVDRCGILRPSRWHVVNDAPRRAPSERMDAHSSLWTNVTSPPMTSA